MSNSDKRARQLREAKRRSREKARNLAAMGCADVKLSVTLQLSAGARGVLFKMAERKGISPSEWVEHVVMVSRGAAAARAELPDLFPEG